MWACVSCAGVGRTTVVVPIIFIIKVVGSGQQVMSDNFESMNILPGHVFWQSCMGKLENIFKRLKQLKWSLLLNEGHFEGPK